ncbi:hypothetical protein HELRODRAFT_190894 [Helobdella robusta]|uniref:DZF domain-containing protein n=1 Tax=Helobdella robusta TaxID=6412 RepID=T1FSE5_HELRO|nr:hypothetical protein HELRODRAFT_190894 [Helobdella robusta]ESO08110.1 hypothetical protein HELRODRAFT_190894 [Helobdella robusta]
MENLNVFESDGSCYQNAGLFPENTVVPGNVVRGKSFVYSSASLNRRQAQSFEKVAKVKDNIKVTCNICQITCDGQKQYGDHLNGQKHKKKAEMAERIAHQSENNKASVVVSDSFQQKQEQLKQLIQSEKEQSILRQKQEKALSENKTTHQQLHSSAADEQLSDEDGKKTQVLLKQKMQVPSPNIPFYCKLCNVLCNSSEPFKLHLTGAKHLKKLSKQNDSLEKNNNNNINITNIASNNSNNNNINKSNANSEANVVLANTDDADANTKTIDTLFDQLLGADYLRELLNEKGIINYRCELCSVTIPDAHHTKFHLEGRKHKVNYRKKVDPSIVLPPKHINKTLKLQEAKAQKRKIKEDFWRQKDMMMTGMPDAYIHKKCISCQPLPAKLQYVLNFVDHCELALQIVSDIMVLEEQQRQEKLDSSFTTQQQQPQTNNNNYNDEQATSTSTAAAAAAATANENATPPAASVNAEKFRILQGAMRVGGLCTGLILDSDDKFDIVALTSVKPTVEMLNYIYRLLPDALKKVIQKVKDNSESQQQQQQQPQQPQYEYDHDIHMIEDDDEILVQTCDMYQICISIHLTSSVYDDESAVHTKENDDTNNKDGDVAMLCDDDDQNDDNKDVLISKELCLQWLKALKMANWFQVRAMNLFEGLKVMKIFKKLKMECRDVEPISDWALEVLVERCSFIEGTKATPSDIFRCLLQVLASGILLDGVGLQDPCENSLCDVFGDLQTQQREDLTKYAQTALRLLTFERLHTVLSMEKLQRKSIKPPESKKLKSNNDDDDDNDNNNNNSNNNGNDGNDDDDVSAVPSREHFVVVDDDDDNDNK